MFIVSDEQFSEFIHIAMARLPQEHIRHLENVAIVYEDQPTRDQRVKLKLRNDQTLFGLYEGVPLSQRQGMVRVLPDKITLFKGPICASVNTESELGEQVRHTLWHEIAHYYGLDHEQIHRLEV
jgi:predicted Zn-dependent protease with MMP-like domain